MKKLILLLLCSSFLFSFEYKIMTEDLKPYNYVEDKKLKGISAQIVQKLLKEFGYDSTIEVLPWARALHLLNVSENAILFSMSYTKERAKKYKFACPLSEVDVFFFVKNNKKLNLQTIEDIKDLKIGVVKDFSAHKTLQKKGFTRFDYSSSTKDMVKKLQQEKIDTFVAAPFTVYSLDMDLSQIRQTSLKLYSTDLCIAFNKKISDAEVLKWQNGLQRLRQDGTYEKLYQKYFSFQKGK